MIFEARKILGEVGLEVWASQMSRACLRYTKKEIGCKPLKIIGLETVWLVQIKLENYRLMELTDGL